MPERKWTEGKRILFTGDDDCPGCIGYVEYCNGNKNVVVELNVEYDAQGRKVVKSENPEQVFKQLQSANRLIKTLKKYWSPIAIENAYYAATRGLNFPAPLYPEDDHNLVKFDQSLLERIEPAIAQWERRYSLLPRTQRFTTQWTIK